MDTTTDMQPGAATPRQPQSPPIAVDVPVCRPGRGDRGARYKVLFLHPGPTPPNADPWRNALFHLSRCCEGDIVTTRWKVPEDDLRPRQAVRFDSLGDFEFHATRSTMINLLRVPKNLIYFLMTGLRLSRTKGPYDAIVAYGPFTPELQLAGSSLA